MRIYLREPAWRDAVIVVAITALSIAVSVRFNLNEALYALTRRGERLQVDELPIGMLVLLMCLMWLSWRRYREAQRELRARRAAEARLEGLLAANRELARESLRIQEAERKHLARELHDELGQYLNAIKLDAVSIGDRGAADAQFAMAAAGAIIRSVNHVHTAVGGMIARLRPVGLDELGLLAAIEHCVDEWRARLPQTHFELVMRGQFEDLNEHVSLTTYRLIQEGLTNVCKHAQADRVEILLQRLQAGPGAAGELHVTVADNGRGMPPNNIGSRFGMQGMRERVEMQGGKFHVESTPGRGLRLAAHLPDV
jgi:glucose-6-phosphate-specific signal transduction histidine kinase